MNRVSGLGSDQIRGRAPGPNAENFGPDFAMFARNRDAIVYQAPQFAYELMLGALLVEERLRVIQLESTCRSPGWYMRAITVRRLDTDETLRRDALTGRRQRAEKRPARACTARGLLRY
jgi:hypothetical protein